MRIVHIEDFFHPNAGYQLNILTKYMAKAGHEVIIVTCETAKMPNHLSAFFGQANVVEDDIAFEKKNDVKIIRVPVKKFISSRAIYDKGLYKLIDDLNPDVLYVHGNDTYCGMQYIKRYKKLKYKLIMDSHMVDFASKNRLAKVFRWYYKKRIAPSIIRNNIKVIRTVEDDFVERCLGIPLTQAPYLGFGSDTLLFNPNEKEKELFRKEKEITNEDFVILYAGKLDEKKGGLFFAEAIKKKINANKNIVFIVVGTVIDDKYGEEVESMFSKSENRILRFPTQKYSELAKFFQASDLFVIPKQCSLTLYDVGACGVPVLAENNSVNIERLSHNNGFTFEADNKENFISKIVDIINIPNEKYEKIKENAYEYITKNYNYEDVANKYIDIIEKL